MMLVDRITHRIAAHRRAVAQARLAAMVAANRAAPATVQYRQRRAAALSATREQKA